MKVVSGRETIIARFYRALQIMEISLQKCELLDIHEIETFSNFSRYQYLRCHIYEVNLASLRTRIER